MERIVDLEKENRAWAKISTGLLTPGSSTTQEERNVDRSPGIRSEFAAPGLDAATKSPRELQRKGHSNSFSVPAWRS